jgi:biopolymer transport protein ExbB
MLRQQSSSFLKKRTKKLLFLGAGISGLCVSPMAFAETIAGTVLPTNLSVSGMFLKADIVVQVVLAGLILASVATWTVLLAKGIAIYAARRSAAQALLLAENAQSLASLHLSGPEQTMLEAAITELRISVGGDATGIKERVASRLQRIEIASGRHIARGTGLLATIGATAPFIGLFGTVWGIMNSFIGISRSQTTNLAVVAPGIAEALLATATGLLAAIPAVVIYNVFARSIGGYRATLADLGAALQRLVSRDLDLSRHRLKLAAE